MFNPVFRYKPEELNNQAIKIIESPLFRELLQFIPLTFLILNEARQVIYANKDIVKEAGFRRKEQLTGLRPGECFDCIRAVESISGCGTTAYCKVCGFANAITNSSNGKEQTEECIIALKDGESLSLNIQTRQFQFNGHNFLFCTIEDNSEIKSKQMLENIFLHDIRNTTTVLSGLRDVFSDMPTGEVRQILRDVSVRIDEEIQSYRIISSAENRTLVANSQPVEISQLISETINSLRINPRFAKKQINYSGPHHELFTDKTLLRQVLINMVKNALEAGPHNDTIRITSACDPLTKNAQISVTNKQVISPENKLRIFQKSFSTKGTGRGWGTYSIKLLTTKYLRGIAEMTSNKKQGTIFSISIPSLDNLNSNVNLQAAKASDFV